MKMIEGVTVEDGVNRFGLLGRSRNRLPKGRKMVNGLKWKAGSMKLKLRMRMKKAQQKYLSKMSRDIIMLL